MFNAHQLIQKYGIEIARKMAASKFERNCIDAANTVINTEDNTTIYASLLVSALPHRRLTQPPNELNEWQRNIGEWTYSFSGGISTNEHPTGIPFGSKARLILLYLHGRAIRSASPHISTETSMHAWVCSMGIKPGGISYRQVAEQATRIAECDFQRNIGHPLPNNKHPLIKTLTFRENSKLPFTDNILLGDQFFQAIIESPIELSLPALQQISDNSWAIDLYIWLAYQLPRQQEPQFTEWPLFYKLFGLGYKQPRQMKASFIKALSLVKAAYPEANIEVEGKGFVLHPSPPPISSGHQQAFNE